MKYLIFGDVHGNLVALEKLLEIEKNKCDKFVSHGDVVNYGPWSNECVDLLDSLPNLITLKGNHEENFIAGSYTGKNEVAQAFFKKCYPTFSKINTICKYEDKLEIKKFRIKHTVNDVYLFPDTDLSEFEFETNFIIGHSHYQFDRTSGNKRIVNTGSLGQNRKFINVAEYIIYDECKDLIELKSFIYDIDVVIDKMVSDNYPEICTNYYKNKKKA